MLWEQVDCPSLLICHQDAAIHINTDPSWVAKPVSIFAAEGAEEFTAAHEDLDVSTLLAYHKASVGRWTDVARSLQVGD